MPHGHAAITSIFSMTWIFRLAPLRPEIRLLIAGVVGSKNYLRRGRRLAVAQGGFFPPSQACYVESCHGVDSKLDSKRSSLEPGFSGWFAVQFTVHFAVKTHGFGWMQ